MKRQENVSKLNMQNIQPKEKKQFYLREQIIEAGYSPQQFIKYLNSILDINSDLNLCTLEQLEEVVISFQKKKEDEKNQLNTYFLSDSNQNEDTICQPHKNLIQPTRILIKKNPDLFQEQFISTSKCVKINDQYDHLKGKIMCQVTNPDRKHMGGILGIGATSYLCFDVWSYGFCKYSVSRRYSDFVWLRNILTKFYPTFIIPPIPNKKANKRLPRQIRKRMRILSYFLNDIVKMPILLNNKYVQGFLTIKQHQKFESLKEQGDKKKSYQNMYSTETLNGKVQLQLSSKTIKYKEGLNKFVSEVEVLYKQITRNSKKINALTVDKINLLYKMSFQFQSLFDISNKFNTFVKSESTQRLSQIYALLNNMMVQWGNSLKKQMEQVQKNLSTFFKYVREQFIGFKQLFSKISEAESAWVYEKELLEKQKQKIFSLKDFKKWQLTKKEMQNIPSSALFDKNEAFKIMLPKQSVRVTELKKSYAYYLSQLLEHGNQNFSRCADRFCENFKQFSIKTKVNNQEIGALWTEVSYKFSDPYKKKTNIMKTVLENIDDSQGQINISYDD